MPNTSLLLSLPYIEGGQAQKHVTHNEALRALDAVVQLAIRGTATEPAADAAEGDRFVVAPGASGAFAGQEGQIALREAGGWVFFAPRPGWIAYNAGTGGLIAFTGADWTPLSGAGGGAPTSTDRLGINAAADATNRLSVSAEATLLSHDGDGHQLKINKSASVDTASLLFQTGFSGRAEMGTTGSDDFEIKVSADGATFQTGLRIDAATGAVSLPNTALSEPAFGAPTLVTRDYVVARGAGLLANATGALGNSYNFPASLAFDAATTPGLPGAFVKSGYYTGADETTEAVPVDPNRLYRFGAYLRQEGLPGDWSAFATADRHAHSIGLRCYDADGLPINAAHHMTYRHAGTNSRTFLTQPLAPGDTVLDVADAGGWNESSASAEDRGLIIFGYASATGRADPFYSRLEDIDLFDLGGVDKATNRVTLNQPLPASLGNPADPGGVWPAGTPIANRTSDWNYKFALFEALVPAATETWFRCDAAIGGTDRSGRNAARNFAPGTAFVRPAFLLNYTNRTGGFAGHADTGNSHRVWIAGLTFETDPTGRVTPAPSGASDLHVVTGDPATGALAFVPADLVITAT